jgi:hypothetical protein
MTNYAKSYSLYLVVSFLVNLLAIWLASPFLKNFLTQSLVTLLVALIAINTAARTALLTKIKELGDKEKIQFSKTSRSMKAALYEQVACLFIAILFSILATSTWAQSLNYGPLIALTLLGVPFLSSIQILVDTGRAALRILEYQYGG